MSRQDGSDWCQGKDRVVKIVKMTNEQVDDTIWQRWDRGRVKNVKRIVVRCPVCRRRLMTSVEADGDGDLWHRIPPHKRKGWKRKAKSPRRKGAR